MAAFPNGMTSVCTDESTTSAPKRQCSARRVPRLTVKECSVDLLTSRCNCEINCWDKIRKFDSAAFVMADARQQFAQAGQRGSSKLLFNMLLPMRMLVANKILLQYSICGLVVCADAYFGYFGLLYSDSRVKRVLALIRQGCTTWSTNSSHTTGRPNQRGIYATAWMRQHILDHADQMPHKCLFRLDPVMRQDLHTVYKRHEVLCNHVALSYSRFCEVWKIFFHKGISLDGINYKCEMRPGIYACLCATFMHVF